MVHVVVLDVRDDGDVGMELEEGAVALVGLGDEVVACAGLGVRAEIRHLAADNDGRRDARRLERDAEHGGRRRLAVRAGDGDALVLIDERRVDVRAVELRDAEVARREHLGVVVGDGGRDDDGVGAAHVLRALAAERHARAELPEIFDDAGVRPVGARDLVAELAEDLRERAHAGAADADEMDGMDAFEFFQVFLHFFFLISWDIRAPRLSARRDGEHELRDVRRGLGTAQTAACRRHLRELCWL